MLKCSIELFKQLNNKLVSLFINKVYIDNVNHLKRAIILIQNAKDQQKTPPNCNNNKKTLTLPFDCVVLMGTIKFFRVINPTSTLSL